MLYHVIKHVAVLCPMLHIDDRTVRAYLKLMSILRYLKRPASDLPQPAEVPGVPASTVLAVNRSVESTLVKKRRSCYNHYSYQNKLDIGRYAIVYGTSAAVRKYSKALGFDISESTVRGFKKEVKAMLDKGELTPDQLHQQLDIAAIPPPPKRGRPTLLGDLEQCVMEYIKALRLNGGIVNSAILVGVANAVMSSISPEKLLVNGGTIEFTCEWAKKWLSNRGWSKRKGTTSKGQTPKDFPDIKLKYLQDIQQLVSKYNVPPKLLVNWDQTACKYIQCGEWTMDETGSKNVPITGLDDKREITVLFAGAADGTSLLIYGGKTDRSHPQGIQFPHNWNIHVTHNDNHWSNEATMLEYLEKVIKPYKEKTIHDLGLQDDQKMIVLFDVFRAHRVDSCKEWLACNNIEYVCVPANCTDKLQPMDLGVNKPFKDAMKKEFIAWYSDQVRTQLDRGTQIEAVKVDMRLSVVKPLSARWTIKAVEQVASRPREIKKGFERAGILEYVYPELI